MFTIKQYTLLKQSIDYFFVKNNLFKNIQEKIFIIYLKDFKNGFLPGSAHLYIL